jgi:hypothetical protein
VRGTPPACRAEIPGAANPVGVSVIESRSPCTRSRPSAVPPPVQIPIPVPTRAAASLSCLRDRGRSRGPSDRSARGEVGSKSLWPYLGYSEVAVITRVSDWPEFAILLRLQSVADLRRFLPKRERPLDAHVVES